MVRLKLHFGRRSDLVIYCFKAGPDFTASYYQQQMNIVRNMLTQRATSSALVRISTVIPEGESDEQAERRLLDFARRAMPELREKLN
jgi:EpsI family protein